VPAGDARLLIACSGGADSGAALLLTRAARPAASLIACYVDHRLRSRTEIRKDIAAVNAQARAAGARVVIKRCGMPDFSPAYHSTSPEARARDLRYAALLEAARESGASLIVTGHQRDDLVESSLLALMRGSGIDGVAALRPRRRLASSIDIVRPLLWASKAELETALASKGIRYSIDATNADKRLRRNLVRALLGELETAVPGSLGAVARSAALLREDQALLEELTAQAWRSALTASSDLSVAALRSMPRALVRRVVRHAVRQQHGSARDFHFTHCDAVARAIAERRGGSFHAGETRVILSAGKLIVEAPRGAIKSPAGQEFAFRIERGHRQSIETPWGRLAFTRSKRPLRQAIGLDADRLPAGSMLAMRTARTGDKFTPAGRSHAVPLARFLAKAGIPEPRRTSMPVLCKDGTIIAVLGLRASAEYAAHPRHPILNVAFRAKLGKEP
jgi:tRNA(Ile)-lysidine synthase